ncbi:MAG: twitching motility protein PilT [Gaiellales bacterium]|nr:twitching motility protein PilT [Gaiellales bacterium]
MSALQDLPCAEVVQHEEVPAFIAARCLMGKGLGFVDAHLLASALVSGAALWTLDRRLHDAVAELNCAYAEAH